MGFAVGAPRPRHHAGKPEGEADRQTDQREHDLAGDAQLPDVHDVQVDRQEPAKDEPTDGAEYRPPAPPHGSAFAMPANTTPIAPSSVPITATMPIGDDRIEPVKRRSIEPAQVPSSLLLYPVMW